MTTNSPITNAAIIMANLEALHIRLQYATRLAGAASVAMAQDNQNRAVGTILECEILLPECDALFRTILLMHRSRTSFEQNEVHS
jgi:hypothetical protein